MRGRKQYAARTWIGPDMSGEGGSPPALTPPTRDLSPAPAAGERIDGGEPPATTTASAAASREADRLAAASRSSRALFSRTWGLSAASCPLAVSWRGILFVARATARPPHGADARLGRDARRCAPSPSPESGASAAPRLRFGICCLAARAECHRSVAASAEPCSIRRRSSLSMMPRACNKAESLFTGRMHMATTCLTHDCNCSIQVAALANY